MVQENCSADELVLRRVSYLDFLDKIRQDENEWTSAQDKLAWHKCGLGLKLPQCPSRRAFWAFPGKSIPWHEKWGCQRGQWSKSFMTQYKKKWSNGFYTLTKYLGNFCPWSFCKFHETQFFSILLPKTPMHKIILLMSVEAPFFSMLDPTIPNLENIPYNTFHKRVGSKKMRLSYK